MNKESETNAYGNGGVNASKAGLLKKLKSLSEIRKYRHLLKNEDQIKEQQKQASDEWFDIIHQVSDMQKVDSNQFINLDIAEARLQEAMTKRDPIAYLNKEYGYKIDKNSELASDLMNFIDKAKEMPVKYFETKFKRPVGIEEFAIAVVPTTTSPEVVKALKDAGLEVHTYEKGSEGDPNDEARIKATMDAVKGRSDIMFQMVGKEGAREADKNEGSDERSRNLTLAEDSEKAGVDPKAIKLATGWERGADGQWRYEIPDADVDIIDKYNEKYSELAKKGIARPVPTIDLVDLLGKDNELFKYYPELKSMPVQFSETLGSGTSGSFDGNIIKLNAEETVRFDDKDLNNENIYGTLLHEIQHAIQDIEGFARGGNLQTSTTEDGINAIIEKKERQRADIKTRLNANNKILSDPENLKMSAELEGKTEKEVRDQLTETVDQQAAEYDTLGLQIDRLRHTKAPSMTDARDLYHSLAGEVEARNVTDRMNMTDEERRNSLASDTEDVPREDQVIIKGNGGQLASIVDNEDKKTILRERSGVVSGNSSSEDLLSEGGGHLSHNALTLPKDGAKLRKNSEITLSSAKKIQNEGGLKKKIDNAEQAARALGNGLHLEKSKSSQSYYRDYYEGEFDVNGKTLRLRISTHPATGKRMGNVPADDKISIVVYKNGEHIDNGPHDGYSEYTYYPEDISPKDAANAIVKSVEGLIKIGEYIDETGKAKRKDYPYEENGIIHYQRVESPESEMTPEERQYWNQWSAAMKKWKERNAIPANENEAPEKPKFQQGESALDYAQKLVNWNRQKALWQTAPKR